MARAQGRSVDAAAYVTRLTIISGGQTGVDRAALDAARKLGLPSGGYIPFGRWTEEGPLPDDYAGMVETEGPGPSARTKRNVRESDATLIITRGSCEGGTLLTSETARKSGKPQLVIDLAVVDQDGAVAAISEWLSEISPGKLNVAGPRASKNPSIYAEAVTILLAVFSNIEPPG